MADKFRLYNTASRTYQESGYYTPSKMCNGFTAINFSDVTVTVNDIPLLPSATPLTVAGDSVSFGGNENEIFRGQFKIQFATGGAISNLVIVEKYFTEDYTQ